MLYLEDTVAVGENHDTQDSVVEMEMEMDEVGKEVVNVGYAF